MTDPVISEAMIEAAITRYLVENPHVYLSTGCQHGRHDYCAAMVGVQGEKRPARCKWCEARCVCPCHVDQANGEPDGSTDGELRDPWRHWADVREVLGKLDGTRRARVALRTGIPVEELDELGGVGGEPDAKSCELCGEPAVPGYVDPQLCATHRAEFREWRAAQATPAVAGAPEAPSKSDLQERTEGDR